MMEVADINGDRFADSGDQLELNRRIARQLPAHPVSDSVFDLNKDAFVDSGDQLMLNQSTCTYRHNGMIGCPACPPE
jgi:hypothetical protein